MGARDQGADRDAGRWMTIPRTLCFITNGADVLLMKRAETKRTFPGRYNGIGGHIERDEDPYTSALREIKEETGLSLSQLALRGVYNVDAAQEVGITLFIFTGESTSREVIEGDEGSLHWVPIARVGELSLVEDLPFLLPRLFGNRRSESPFFAHVSYDENDQIVMRFTPG
jgi:8-oxo-dGTP diphosphatase